MKRLRKALPLPLPVVVRRKDKILPHEVTGEEIWAETVLSFKDKKPHHFIIYIAAKLKEEASLAMLLEHEYAHCMSWDFSGNDSELDHGLTFGISYATIYDTLEDGK